MSDGKRPRDRRRWSPPQHPDPKQKEFAPPLRRENDVARLQVKGWLKLAETALNPEPNQTNTQAESDEQRAQADGEKTKSNHPETDAA